MGTTTCDMYIGFMQYLNNETHVRANAGLLPFWNEDFFVIFVETALFRWWIFYFRWAPQTRTNIAQRFKPIVTHSRPPRCGCADDNGDDGGLCEPYVMPNNTWCENCACNFFFRFFVSFVEVEITYIVLMQNACRWGWNGHSTLDLYARTRTKEWYCEDKLYAFTHIRARQESKDADQKMPNERMNFIEMAWDGTRRHVNVASITDVGLRWTQNAWSVLSEAGKHAGFFRNPISFMMNHVDRGVCLRLFLNISDANQEPILRASESTRGSDTQIERSTDEEFYFRTKWTEQALFLSVLSRRAY